MSALRQKIRIGDLLVQNKVITEDQLQLALQKQKSTGTRLGRTLVTMGYVPEDKFLEFLSEQLKIPFIDLRRFRFDPVAVKRLSETFARRYRAIVLSDRKGELLVGMVDPTDLYAFDALERILQQPITQAVVRESELLNTLDMVYRRTDEIASFAEELEEELTDGQFDLAALSPDPTDSDAPVVKLLQSIFLDAMQVRASDVHIEPDETVLRIRQRVDGVLQEQVVKERRITSALVLRLKLMSGLDISEKRLPQDGRFSIKIKERKVDVRLSTMPVEYGESVVMRLLDQTDGVTDLENVGMPEAILGTYQRLITQPHGMILITGPTGSGKTTTLYATLEKINSEKQKIITVEDPVEYQSGGHHPDSGQCQHRPELRGRTALHRAAGPRRADGGRDPRPRDRRDCHRVCTDGAPGVLDPAHQRCGIQCDASGRHGHGRIPGSHGDSCRAQRLVRRLCEYCCAEHDPSPRDRAWIEKVSGVALAPTQRLQQASGCHRCNNTGYRGRIGVFELLVINDEMADALRRTDSSGFVKAARASRGYQPLVKSAVLDAIAGVTSLDEVFIVAEQIDETGDWVFDAQEHG
jgi:MSHA biogenesis protein MshE